jgi:drug/metabolite transporter (DMT)-like permease
MKFPINYIYVWWRTSFHYSPEEPDLISGRGYGTAAAFVTAVIWGLSFVAARMVLTTLTPVLLATVRFIIASLIFLPVVISGLRNGSRPTNDDLKEMALLGFMSISIYFWLQYTGVQYAGAGVSALLVVGLIPILTGFASSFILKESFSPQKVTGAVLGLAGVALITVPGLLGASVDWGFYFGVACLLGNAVCWSLYTALSRRIVKRTGKPLMVTAYVTLAGTLALLPMSLTSNWGLVASVQQAQWVSVLYLAVVCSGGGYFLWNYALSKTEAVNTAVWLYLEPVAAFIGEAALFGIIPGALTLLGGAGIIMGALLTNTAKK